MKQLLKYIFDKLGYKVIKRKKGYHYVPNIYGHRSHKLIDLRENKEFESYATKVIRDKTTSLYYDRLYTFYQLLRHIKNLNVPKPLLVEAGVYKGGSAYFIASVAAKLFQGDCELWAVDTFEGFDKKDLPYGTEGHNSPGVFGDVDCASVKKYLAAFPFVTVIKGRIQNSVHLLNDKRCVFAHLDMDLYEPTKFALDFFGRKLVPFGAIVVDDHNTLSCPGIAKAVNEFLGTNAKFIKLDLPGQALLIKYI